MINFGKQLAKNLKKTSGDCNQIKMKFLNLLDQNKQELINFTTELAIQFNIFIPKNLREIDSNNGMIIFVEFIEGFQNESLK
jgi:hypothetical protein